MRFLAVSSLVFLLTACGSDEPPAAAESAPEPAAMTDAAAEAASPELCLDAGPQTPRDISSVLGLNPVTFERAPAATEMNLCNIHTHTNAEHKGPGFSVFAGDGKYGGYRCNGTSDLTAEELAEIAICSADTAATFGIEPLDEGLARQVGRQAHAAVVRQRQLKAGRRLQGQCWRMKCWRGWTHRPSLAQPRLRSVSGDECRDLPPAIALFGGIIPPWFWAYICNPIPICR